MMVLESILLLSLNFLSVAHSIQGISIATSDFVMLTIAISVRSLETKL